MTELQLKELLADMSLEEKIEQMIQFHGGFYGDVKLICPGMPAGADVWRAQVRTRG